MGFEKYKRWTKVDTCFSFNEFCSFLDGFDPNFAPISFRNANLLMFFFSRGNRIWVSKNLTSDVSAFLLLGKALALGDIVEKVEKKIHILRALSQNLLLNGF